jgi:hypothetical protein
MHCVTMQKTDTKTATKIDTKTQIVVPTVCVLITSTLVPDLAKPLSYTLTRSVYTPEERLWQTLQTIRSVQTFCPKARIVLADNSRALPKNFIQTIEATGTEVVAGYAQDADSIHKALGEAHCTLLGLEYLKKTKLADLIVKVCARYQLTNKFDLARFSLKQMSFWRDANHSMVRTVLYTVPEPKVNAWIECLHKIRDGQSSLGYEIQMHQHVQDHANYVDVLGVAGHVSVDGTWFDG